MRTYERNGVHVDQCSDCRGLFLDRGELERLVDAEGSFYREQPSEAPAQRSHQHQHPKKRKKNFLEELFD
jgi:Zn-finger nucleic acid-binding protein